MNYKILVETSARHIHLTREHCEILFGEDFKLHKKKELSQPGQFACVERVAVIGPRNQFAGVTILGPFRSETQVELSASDAFFLGIKAPVRRSGDLAGSGSCILAGPCGQIELKQGVIIAKRHIHIDDMEAEKLGIQDGQLISVKIQSDDRSLAFGDVVVRTSRGHIPVMHIDTDEANAAGCAGTVYGEIIL